MCTGIAHPVLAFSWLKDGKAPKWAPSCLKPSFHCLQTSMMDSFALLANINDGYSNIRETFV